MKSNMKNIMLCLNQLGIGGVETAVLNQTIQLKKMGYTVFILAKEGIYKDKFEEQGAIILNFEFVIQNKINLEKIYKIINIIKKYNIEQVHIHQFDCISVVFPACVFANIPYIAYAHTGIRGVYDWFENSYECYKILFEIYFKNAKKIITITEDAKIENKEKYKVDDEKYIVIKNSIDFEKFKVKNNCMPKKIENFLILSRMGKEKLISLKNAVDIFKEYSKEHTDTKLTIAGDGEIKNKIEVYIKDIKENVILLGKINNVSEIIAQNDIVLGVDRCILEAIAMKKIALISGYDAIKGIVTPENINAVSDYNFSAKNLKNLSIAEAVRLIEDLDETKIREIVNKNYEYATENLNVSKNIFVLGNKKTNVEDYTVKYFMESFIKALNLCDEKNKNIENNWKEYLEAKKWYEGQIKNQENEIVRLKNELKKQEIKINEKEIIIEQIYNGKSWKIAEKIRKIFKIK